MQEKLKTKLVLFDLDGTLIDTAPDFLLSLNNILIKYGKKTLRLSDIRSIVSDGSAKLVEFGFNVSSDDKQAAVYRSELLIEYKKNLMKSSKLFTGVKELINYLVKENIIFGIVTNKPYEYAYPLVNNFKMLKKSKILICPEHLSKTKPDPEGILLACSKLNITPKNCVYIGDHPKDIQAGINAGTQTIGCLYGYSITKESNSFNIPLVKNADSIIELIK